MTVKDCTNVKEFWQLKEEIRGAKGDGVEITRFYSFGDKN